MNTTPYKDRIIIKPDPKKSNLVKPSGAVEELWRGTVKASYEGCHISEGERVVYDIASGSSIKINGEDFLLLRMVDIFGTVLEK